MPTSHPWQLNEIMQLVMNTKARSLLDVGVGFGKYGYLAREYMELWDGRQEYGDWRCRIDGVEAFERYITPVHRQIYSNLYIGNALEVLPALDFKYDVVLLLDVIEHFTKEDGHELLRRCLAVGRNVIVSTPRDIGEQGAAFSNPFERHISQWRSRDFRRYPERFQVFNPESLLVFTGQDGRRVAQLTAAQRRERSRLAVAVSSLRRGAKRRLRRLGLVRGG